MIKTKGVYSLTVVLLLTATFSVSAFSLFPPYAWDTDMINVREVHDEGYTGDGVYVAVLDTGLVANWRDYFPRDRINTKLARGFYEAVHMGPDGELQDRGKVTKTSYLGKNEHGSHVTSVILGYSFYGTPIVGVAPDATIIPIKVLDEYHIGGEEAPFGVTFGTDSMVAAGIRYATELALSGYSPMIITMSLGGPEPSPEIKEAIDYAVSENVIVVAAAGNDGDEGMDWPGAYTNVISVGSCGWTLEWLGDLDPEYVWWVDDVIEDLATVDTFGNQFQAYVSEFSGREKSEQDLDVVAPGSWVVGPYPYGPGMSHLPWWSHGNPQTPFHGNYYYVGGTSQATPHVAGVIALLLEADMEDGNQDLTAAEVEYILEDSALPIQTTSAWVFDPFEGFPVLISWGSDATGAGIVQADVALTYIP